MDRQEIRPGILNWFAGIISSIIDGGSARNIAYELKKFDLQQKEYKKQDKIEKKRIKNLPLYSSPQNLKVGNNEFLCNEEEMDKLDIFANVGELVQDNSSLMIASKEYGLTPKYGNLYYMNIITVINKENKNGTKNTM